MGAFLRLVSLIALCAEFALLVGAVVYLAVPERPLLAAILGPLGGVVIVAIGIMFNLDQWLVQKAEAIWPG